MVIVKEIGYSTQNFMEYITSWVSINSVVNIYLASVMGCQYFSVCRARNIFSYSLGLHQTLNETIGAD